jgi:hypothetical protein
MAAALLLPSWLLPSEAHAAGMPTMLGVNMMDLMLQYTGTASAQPGGAAAQAAEIAVARKRLADAADQGFTMARVGVMGWGPDAPQDIAVPTANNLTLWLANPDQFWADMDLMFADLDANHIKLVPVFLWNEHQIPTLAGENVTDMIHWPLKSRNLLTTFLKQFISRYKARSTILFYELFNELNLNADLDSVSWCQQNVYPQQTARCASYGNFSSVDMTAFAANLVRQIKTMDGTRKISSGYTFPRPSAWHLQQAFISGNAANAFVADTYAQFTTYMTLIHGPFDIASAHVYPDATDVWFGRSTSQTPLQVDDLTNFAHQNGKLAYIGEFGDTNSTGVSSWLQDTTSRMSADNTDFATVWTWEWYQFDPYTRAAEPNYEPGFTDAADSFFRQLTGAAAPSTNLRLVLSWPQPCDTIGSWDATAYALASGTAGVDSVTFSLNGSVIGTVTAPPFQVSLPTSLAAGTYTLTATASSGTLTASYSTTFGYGQAPTGCVTPSLAAALPTVVTQQAVTQQANVASFAVLRGTALARPAPSVTATLAATPAVESPTVVAVTTASATSVVAPTATSATAQASVATVSAAQTAVSSAALPAFATETVAMATTTPAAQTETASTAAEAASVPAASVATTPVSFAVAAGSCTSSQTPADGKPACASPLGSRRHLSGVRWTVVH